MLRTRHAEIDCLQQLRPFKRTKKKRFKRLNMLVVRTDKIGVKLMLSSPCQTCIKYVSTRARLKGYIFNKIYYMTDGGRFDFIKVSSR